VDISHPNFEEQIEVVNQTLLELKAMDKPIIVVFNKIDKYTFIPRDEDDLLPRRRENYSLEELLDSWMAKNNAPCVFVSARNQTHISTFRNLLYQKVKEIHVTRYPYDRFLY
jgi:GTP-binding protein HflX